MKKRFISMFLIFVMALTGLYSPLIYADGEKKPEELSGLYARSAVLLDGDSGRVLFGKEEDVVRPMASTTKIMTCILALELMEDGQIVAASDHAASQPKVRLGVKGNEEFRLEDLLYSLMLESHNDSAVAIAEGIAGGVEEFADLMNKKAEALGCTDTHFVTPNGLDGSDEEGVHSTTARDLARIMKYCIKDSPKKEEFLHITQTQSYLFSNVAGDRNFSCSNHNAFLGMMEGAVSGKTGFTGDAGYCYVGALERDGRTFIVALLACGWPNNKGYKWSDTKKLMNYGIQNYEYRNVWKDIDPGTLAVKGGYDPDHVFDRTVYAGLKIEEPDKDFQILLRKDENVDVSWKVEKKLDAPVKKGKTVGEVRYTLNGETWRTFPIKTTGRVEKKTLVRCAGTVMDYFFRGGNH